MQSPMTPNQLAKLLVFLLLALPVMSHATEFEFEGTPEVKVQVMDGVAQTEAVAPQEAREFRAVVVREGDQFYWANEASPQTDETCYPLPT
jgi:hypothetical protein